MHKDIENNPGGAGPEGSSPCKDASPEAARRVQRMREQMEAEQLRLGMTEAEYLRHMSASLRKGQRV